MGWLVAKRMRSTPVAATARSSLGEARLAVQVAAVGVHVLAEQGDLEDAVGDETRDLGDDLGSTGATARGPRT